MAQGFPNLNLNQISIRLYTGLFYSCKQTPTMMYCYNLPVIDHRLKAFSCEITLNIENS
jgi:hypothetical protein